MSARQWSGWIALTLFVAAAVHAASLYALPYFVMHRALSVMGETNTMHFGRRVDAQSRGVVRPSPDLLYSTCPYDLSHGAIEVRADVPHDAYWSVSAFDTQTNNWFVRDDRQISGSALDLIIAPPVQDKVINPGTSSEIVTSPTMRGLVLIRTLISNESGFAAVDRTRRLATCGALTNP